MPKKLTYEEVKHFIEIDSNSECILLSTEYKDIYTKLLIKCKCGEIFHTTFRYIKNKYKLKCNKCSKSYHYKAEEINDFLFSLGYTLKDKYVNTKDKITVKDNNGYLYFTNINTLKNGNKPDFVHTSNPYTIQNIKLWCKLSNRKFELISEKYEGNHKKLKWKCLQDGCREIFEMNWSNIHSGQGCPFCAGIKVGLSNCLATKNPELAKEWHPTKNGDLNPYDVTCGSHKEVWWKCEKRHEWKVNILSRAYGSYCPYCTRKLPSEVNNLLVNNPVLCEEWNYKKNKKCPNEFLPHSNLKVWWKCKECGHEWIAQINERNRKDNKSSGCPICNFSKGELKINNLLSNYSICFIPQKTYDDLIGLNKGFLSYDFYLPEYNILIEYQGEFHKSQQKHVSKKKFEIQQEHDRRKKQYALYNNIKLLEIWYWDFDNIEEILEKELNLSKLLTNC